MTDSGTPRRGGRHTLKGGDVFLADFVASFVAGSTNAFLPAKGRVLMSHRRIVLVTAENRTVVPLRTVYDVALGQMPKRVRHLFDDAVLISYVEDERQQTVVVGGSSETIERFTLLLYNALLTGVDVSVVHPASIGGYVSNVEEVPATLRVRKDELVIEGETTIGIRLVDVVYYERIERTVDGTRRPLVSIQHWTDEGVVATEIRLASPRRLNVLGRYLRLDLRDAIAEARQTDVDEMALEALVGLYLIGPEADLESLLDADAGTVDAVLEGLEEQALLRWDDDVPVLTPVGCVVVNDRHISVDTP